ncbi:hypothetical protein DER45DRAFT_623179, partial [Fusarium avenaceum]
MMYAQICLALTAGFAGSVGATTTFSVPAQVPSTAAELDKAPVGVSFEFFMWPSYMTNITPPLQCINNFDQLYGNKMPIRIGGTTQDRATYDEKFDGYVSYHTDDPLVAPMELIYGPKFFDLIRQYGHETIVGLNRGDDNLTNTMAAVKMLKSRAEKNVWAVELGNEPDIYGYIWNKTLALDQPPWDNAKEGAHAANWAQAFIDVWKTPLPILAAGGYAIPFDLKPNWPNTDYLINHSYNKTIKAATKVYNTHLYTFSNESILSGAMNHAVTVKDVSKFVEKVKTARSVGRPYIIGETGFHGLDEEMDATYGGALQVLDKTLWALSIGIQKLYYHQGTINQAFFNWWSDNQVNAPFYGGYMAALAVNGGDRIVAVDDGSDSYAQYIIYKSGKPTKALLINTDYYSGIGRRSSKTFTLTGLSGLKLKTIRMTASSSETTTSKSQKTPLKEITIGGQYFTNSNCSIRGTREFEEVTILKGQATLSLAASEALLVYL